MITDERTNKIYFSPYLERECPKLWTSIHAALTKRKVRHGLLKFPNYIWCRDYMPIQITDDIFVAYRFEPDYLVKEKRYHKYLFCDGYNICSEMTYQTTGMDLILDGGNVVKCGDTIVMTEKVFCENFAPLRRFLEHTTDLPSLEEVDALSKWLEEKASEMKVIPFNIQCGTPQRNDEDSLLGHQFQMWQLLLSVLQPFVKCLKENLVNPPFEFVEE